MVIPLGHAATPIVAMRHYSVDDGLSQSHVTALAQDRLGFVWIGTAVGLNRFDGHRFTVYRHRDDEPTSLDSNAIYALHVDRAGTVWIGTDKGLNKYDPHGDSFQRISSTRGAGDPAAGAIYWIDSDRLGNLWLAVSAARSEEHYLVRFEPETQQQRIFRFPDLPGAAVSGLAALEGGNILALLRTAGSAPKSRAEIVVGIMDSKSGKFTRFRQPGEAISAAVRIGEHDVSLAHGTGGTYWIGSQGSRIYKLDTARRAMYPYDYAPGLKPNERSVLVTRVIAGKGGSVVVLPTWQFPGGESAANKIYMIPRSGGQPGEISLQPSGTCDLSKVFPISSLIDDSGVLWMGLSGSGVCVADLESGMFSRIDESTVETSLSNNFVRAVRKDAAGALWVGTRAGLDRIDRTRGEVRRYRHVPGDASSLSDNEVMALLRSRDGSIWVGTQFGGLDRKSAAGDGFEHFRHQPGNRSSLSQNHVTALLEDRSGRLWVGTSIKGLNLFRPASRDFTRFMLGADNQASEANNTVSGLEEAADGTIWVGTPLGLKRLDPIRKEVSNVNLHTASPPHVLDLETDPVFPSVLWVATLDRGLIRYDTSSGKPQQMGMRNSLLPSDTVYSVAADKSGSMWAGTNQGLVQIDCRDRSMRIFGKDQGLQSMEFNTRASFVADDGEILMGGVGGLNAFYPRNISQNSYAAKVVITGIHKIGGNRDFHWNPYGIPGHAGTRATPLGSGIRELTFDFVALHFADPARNRYRVKLDGFDPDWRDISDSRTATYTNLPPGEYRFRVKAVSSRGVWSEEEATYNFTISKPFYQTAWFLSLIAGSVVAVILFLHRRRLQSSERARLALEDQVEQRTNELRQALSVIEEQAGQLRESSELKSRFITNVSHDFRTPLSVTLGSLTDLRNGEYGNLNEPVREELDTIIRNERRLLRLVDQLMMIARLDAGKLQLNVSECNLLAMAEEIATLLGPLARRKGVNLEWAGDDEVVVRCDSGWMEEAVINLVVNAVKFSPPGGSVRIDVSADQRLGIAVFSIQDDGPGISAEEIDRVFDRFYQTEAGYSTPQPGMGLGLAIAKEIVLLHGGEILVSSPEQGGALFQIRLKLATGQIREQESGRYASEGQDRIGIRSMLEAVPLEDLDPAPIEREDEDGARPTLLVAEDDRDLRVYLVRRFRDHYRVVATDSGSEAWRLVQQELPDIVVSDVMLPGLGGVELCEKIRNSDATNFIPVILLTAKAGVDDKLRGLEAGADDYIPKPFEAEELRVKVGNILRSRERLRTRLAAEVSLPPHPAAGEPVPDSVDAVFVRRLFETIRRRAQEPEFGVEQLAQEMAMSRMHLYRRIRETLSRTPHDVLMEYRLDRAAELLAARCGTVSEIAYGLGFKNLSHFTRRFRERHGRTPSEHRAAGKERRAASGSGA